MSTLFQNNNPGQRPLLHTGMILDVLNEENQVIFPARVEEMTLRSIKLVNAAEDTVPQVFYNTKVKLRGYLPDQQTVLFQGVVRGNSPHFWVIEELTGRVTKGRAFFRQSVAAKAKVACANHIFAPDKHSTSRSQTVDCTILDISGGGIRISCAEPYQMEDWLVITEASFPFASGVFSFSCKVMHAEEKGRQYIYGCQFEKLTQREQDRLIEIIFLLQREEVQQKQKRAAR